MGRYADEVLENAIGVLETTHKILEEGKEELSVFERVQLDFMKELREYRSVCDSPEKLKLIDDLYLERCEEINRLRAELEEVKYENEETKKYNLELMEELDEIKNETIDEFVKEALKQLTEFDLKHGYPTVVDCKIILRDTAEKIKEVQDVN